MPISTNMLILARYVWQSEGHHYYVCRHYRATVVIGAVTQTTVAVYLANRDAARIASCMAGTFTQVGTYTHTIKPLSFPENGFGMYIGTVPPYSLHPLPPQLACLVRLHLLLPQPRRQGRIYIPSPPVEALTSDAKVSPTYKSHCLTALAPLATQITVGFLPNRAVLTPVVWHRPGNLATRITSISVDSRWANQRKRGRGERPTPSPFRAID